MSRLETVSIIIPTIVRLRSLRETLRSLAEAACDEIQLDVAVSVNTEPSALFDELLAEGYPFTIRLFFEPRTGKAFALNRALDQHPELGEIVAVLDDDITVSEKWLRNVVAITRRWPDHYFFTGTSYIIWQERDIPEWVSKGNLYGWAYSIFGSAKEREIPADKWASGNHFWFRREAIADGRRFANYECDAKTHLEMAEPDFMMRLSLEGKRGIVSPHAVCGHRIQPQLLQLDELERRAIRTGRCFGRVLLFPYRETIPAARKFARHPLKTRVRCLLAIAKWKSLRWWHGLTYQSSAAIAQRLDATVFLYQNIEMLRVSRELHPYAKTSPVARAGHVSIRAQTSPGNG